MTNSYYNTTGNPGTNAAGASSPIRAEFTAIAAGFDKLPAVSGNANKVVVINSAGTALTVTTGTMALAGNLTTTGAFNTSLTQQASVTLILPAVNGTLATLAGTETLTNKTLAGVTTLAVASSLSGTLAVTGSATVSVNLTVAGGFAVTGAASVGGTLTALSHANITGDADIDGTLTTSGAVIFGLNLDVGNNLDVGGTLMVAGTATLANATAAGFINAGTEFRVATTRVVGPRNTGWTAMTGTPDEATAYATGTVTLPQLAGRMMALQTALTTHGLIGT